MDYQMMRWLHDSGVDSNGDKNDPIGGLVDGQFYYVFDS